MIEKVVTEQEMILSLIGLDPKAFEKAAGRIAREENHLACIALRRAIYSAEEEGTKKEYEAIPYLKAFAKLFCPEERRDTDSIWWHSSRIEGQEFSIQNCQDARIFALLMMAKMTKYVNRRRKRK